MPNENGSKVKQSKAIHLSRRTAITHQKHSCIETVLKDTTSQTEQKAQMAE